MDILTGVEMTMRMMTMMERMIRLYLIEFASSLSWLSCELPLLDALPHKSAAFVPESQQDQRKRRKQKMRKIRRKNTRPKSKKTTQKMMRRMRRNTKSKEVENERQKHEHQLPGTLPSKPGQEKTKDEERKKRMDGRKHRPMNEMCTKEMS